MTVDKAFEAEKADMQIQSKGPLIDEMRRAWFYAGYDAGQKTLSTEVQYKIKNIIYTLRNNVKYGIGMLEKLLEAGE